jgi:hypothetical protein
VGSVTGSFANGVSRFSRLFSDQVVAAPEAVTIVPKRGFATTFAQGSGVSASPCRTTTYSRPSAEKPPRPFDIVSGGGSGAPGSMSSSSAGGASRALGGSGPEGSSCSASSPRSPERTARATVRRSTRSLSGIPSPRRRNTPPGWPFHDAHDPPSTRPLSWSCISSR